MNQVTEVQVPLNMGAAARKRVALVDFFFSFLSPEQTLEHFSFNLRLPSPSSPMQSLSSSLASPTTMLGFFPRKDGICDVVAVVLRTNRDEQQTHQGTARQRLHSGVWTPAQGRR